MARAWRAFWVATPALLLPVLILGGLALLSIWYWFFCRIEPGSRVLYAHLGGEPALNAYAGVF